MDSKILRVIENLEFVWKFDFYNSLFEQPNQKYMFNIELFGIPVRPRKGQSAENKCLAFTNMILNNPETNKVNFGTHTLDLYKPPIKFDAMEKEIISNEKICFSILDPVKVPRNLGEEA